MSKNIFKFKINFSLLCISIFITQHIIAQQTVEKIDFTQQIFTITDVHNNSASIPKGNLKIGQSGIVEHTYKDGKTLIVSSAYITKSDTNSSQIKFIPFLELKQKNIPNSNIKVKNKDTFLLNYLYNFSLLITPNNESFKRTKETFPNNIFLHSDIFAAHLKFLHEDLPTKQIIQKFALSQNMGTIFIVLNNNVYIFDTRTFKLLYKQPLDYLQKKSQMPFYTRVKEIDNSIFIKNYSNVTYNTYYKKILGI